MFYTGQLQILMREPVCPDNLNDHIKFCKYASELIERVTGKNITDHNSRMPLLSSLTRVSNNFVISVPNLQYYSSIWKAES